MENNLAQTSEWSCLLRTGFHVAHSQHCIILLCFLRIHGKKNDLICMSWAFLLYLAFCFGLLRCNYRWWRWHRLISIDSYREIQIWIKPILVILVETLVLCGWETMELLSDLATVPQYHLSTLQSPCRKSCTGWIILLKWTEERAAHCPGLLQPRIFIT